ncbi:hypothetical protein RO3G_11762 [Rhizopus delemar RA 99-880]|uniref:Uncharacterized protein n=1 Tax=Rhizopus delemar (strain RA 99-880 / ATCC MYA-4621 / FGSC 9543 / NRRL 43880) TaxID=246409 RepID=I1CF21_RHIO9|nr:hypothetical protein RO3G_11762 [Rhizopus delemar RA 99-880]|eukprot:EIE87051.1 hypothetical protein RO3G_11762 [Rhizopus delemar RA 99-880]
MNRQPCRFILFQLLFKPHYAGFNLEYDEETHYVRSLSGHKVVNRNRFGNHLRLIADGFL